MRRLAACVAISLELCTNSAARAGEMYRWLDTEGRVHFGSEPPPDARAIVPWSPGGHRLRIDPGAERGSAARAPVKSAPAPAAERLETIAGRSETQWRTQAQTLERRVASLERELDELDDSIQAYAGWSTHRDGRAIQRLPPPDRRAELERELESAQVELEAFEDEARRLGVPPGWLR